MVEGQDGVLEVGSWMEMWLGGGVRLEFGDDGARVGMGGERAKLRSWLGG